MTSTDKLADLRRVILEALRVQKSGPDLIPYIDSGHALADVSTKQNHAVFGRRGCGKTLLLHHSAKKLPSNVRCVYVNCEDFKSHSFPNVLLEILDSVFQELETKRTAWFGRKKKLKELIAEIRSLLQKLRQADDEREEKIRELKESEDSHGAGAKAGLELNRGPVAANVNLEQFALKKTREVVEREYRRLDSKAEKLNKALPQLKQKLKDFFEHSKDVVAVYIHIDDFYHLRRVDQPYVMDYVHRLCKDLPLYFKVATLRHASVLYADRDGQPTGAQARHDYQPIDVDFTLENIHKTERQLTQILYEFGGIAKFDHNEIDALFKGEGFRRLVLAGGGVPRDFLSLFLEALDNAAAIGDGCIGKDDVRSLSLETFERRIEELKSDSEREEQDALLAGIYVIRTFCLERKSNAFLIAEQLLRDDDDVRELLYRLLDYRIIHQVSTALTHKTKPGTFRAFVIDIGCYAFMRKLKDRFTEVDLAAADARERLRSAPILELSHLRTGAAQIPADVETALKQDPTVADADGG